MRALSQLFRLVGWGSLYSFLAHTQSTQQAGVRAYVCVWAN